MLLSCVYNVLHILLGLYHVSSGSICRNNRVSNIIIQVISFYSLIDGLREPMCEQNEKHRFLNKIRY